MRHPLDIIVKGISGPVSRFRVESGKWRVKERRFQWWAGERMFAEISRFVLSKGGGKWAILLGEVMGAWCWVLGAENTDCTEENRR
jgi:hypothetical protein